MDFKHDYYPAINDWQNFKSGLPFADVPVIGITKVKDKPISVVDWALVNNYYEKGEHRRGGFALVVFETDEGVFKLKVVNNPFMNNTLKHQTPPFKTIIRRVSTGFIFSDLQDKKPYRRLQYRVVYEWWDTGCPSAPPFPTR
jgi:hypothetical protein